VGKQDDFAYSVIETTKLNEVDAQAVRPSMPGRVADDGISRVDCLFPSDYQTT